jgi:hypothetical protein
VEVLALGHAALDRLKAVFLQPPIEPAPGTDQDQVPIGAQDPRDLSGVQFASCLGNKVEEAIGVGKMARVPALEGNPTLWVEADARNRF